ELAGVVERNRLHPGHRDVSVMALIALPKPRRVARGTKHVREFFTSVEISTCILDEMHYFALAQFRTCLWPCVGRWESGQEAGPTPRSEALLALATGSRRRNRRNPTSSGDAA